MKDETLRQVSNRSAYSPSETASYLCLWSPYQHEVITNNENKKKQETIKNLGEFTSVGFRRMWHDFQRIKNIRTRHSWLAFALLPDQPFQFWIDHFQKLFWSWRDTKFPPTREAIHPSTDRGNLKRGRTISQSLVHTRITDLHSSRESWSTHTIPTFLIQWTDRP